MKDISIYFKARKESIEFVSESIGEKIIIHKENLFPDLQKNSIAIISCPEYRNDTKDPSNPNQDNIYFKSFLNLHYGDLWNFEIYDLGIIKPGNDINDTYFALSQVVAELIKENILPIVIGGSQDLTFAMYQAYQQLEQLVNICTIDSTFDLGEPEEKLKSNAFISKILMHRPCYLFNVSTLGVQAPYVKKSEFDLYNKLFFDVKRLGEINANYRISEPLLRNSDLLSLDLKSIRYSDFMCDNNSPNGFYADQICQIVKYAGISDKLSAFGLFSMPKNNKNTKLNDLISEILWYFLDGFSQRKDDFPKGSKKDYIKFIVNLDDFKDDIVFYKSPKSNRWWMEVPYSKAGSKYERHHLVPCDYEDYLAAMKNEMPDLWWKTFQKLH